MHVFVMFIIGASGSDKQILCASSGARAALNSWLKTVNKIGRFNHLSYKFVF